MCAGRNTNVQCVCLFLMMETTANSALIKSRSSLAGLDPIGANLRSATSRSVRSDIQ